MTAPTLFSVGIISKAHGLKGWLRLKLHNPLSDLLTKVNQLFLLNHNSASQNSVPYRLLQCHPLEPGIFLTHLEGVSNRTEAEALQGSQVFVDRNALPTLEEDEVYLSDLVGYQVFSENHKIGEVTQILFLGGHDLLQIKSATHQEILIPLVPEIVHLIHKETRSIYIHPPEGLVDLNQKSVPPSY